MILEGIAQGFSLLFAGDPAVWSAVRISVLVSLAASLSAGVVALPLGLLIGLERFRLRRVVQVFINTWVALPTVLLGLLVYAILSRQGMLGDLELLFTPTAMAIGQGLLALPIILALSMAAVEKADPRLSLTAFGLGASRFSRLLTCARELRGALLAAMLVGFGRVFSEVGVSMMLGGNIPGYTRNITTAIALETARGDFAMGVALGVVLLAVALGLVLLVTLLSTRRG